MRAPGELLLISCYELGHQPLHLASLHTLLNQAGYSPVSVDTAVETLSDETVVRARFVALCVPMHTALRVGEVIARRVRTLNPDAFLCLYGLYALLNAHYLLEQTADAVIGGEYEEPLLTLVRALEDETRPVVPGVRTRWQNSGPWLRRAPSISPQRTHLPPLSRYAHLQMDGETKLVGYSETTRGCKHTCLHCPITPIYAGRFFAVPAQIVLADIRAQVDQGAQHITFGDPDFLNGPTHALRIARALHQEFPTLTFDATIKIAHLLKHRQLLTEMRALGCAFVFSAVESLNDQVLGQLAKGHTGADVAEACTLMATVGIPLRPSLLPFSPWETLESYLELLTFIEERQMIEHVDPVHLSIRLLIPPGSALLEAPGQKSWLGPLDAAAYTYRWQHPDPRMDILQEQVATLVKQAHAKDQNAVETFFQIKALAQSASGQQIHAAAYECAQYGRHPVVPHLSESWFC